MLTSRCYNSLINWWSSQGETEPQCVVDDKELDRIIEAIAEKPTKPELKLFDDAPITSEDKDFVCQERMGFITKISTNTGTIDNQYMFYLNDGFEAELKVGSKVAYNAYRRKINEEWRVKNIISVYEENWEDVPPVEEDEEGVGEDNTPTPTGESELLSETAILEKTLVCKVHLREGRIAITDTGVRCDLNTTSATFTPLAGDFVALDVIVKVDGNARDLSGEILEILQIRPIRRRTIHCTVTLYDQNSRTGTVDNNIFFQKEFCSPGFIPTRGDKVTVDVIESTFGGRYWRALHVEPRNEFVKPTLPIEERETSEFNDPYIFKDKNGVFLSRSLDFGTMDMGQRRVLEFVIENGSANPVWVKSIDVYRSRSGQLTFCDMPVVPRFLGAGAVMKMKISCHAKIPGHHKETVLVEMEGFKIARQVFCEVTSEMMQGALVKQAPRKERFNYKNSREDALRIHKAQLNSELRTIPGVPLNKAPAFVAFRMPAYVIPAHFWDLLDAPRPEIRDRIFEKFPALRRELDGETYSQRFQFLLYLAEAEGVLDVGRYNMKRVKFFPKGDFLSLTVPGLAEKRPSLLVGDKVNAVSPYVDAPPFQGIIHKMFKSEVYLRFDPAFHSKYVGEDYTVSFMPGRSSWKKCHHAVSKVVQNLGMHWLFPVTVTERPAQIEFEESDYPQQPSLAASASDEEKQAPTTSTPVLVAQKKSRTSIQTEKSDSSSSDEGFIHKRTQPKKSGPPLSKLLNIIKEENAGKVCKETSECEVSSLSISNRDEAESEVPGSTQSPGDAGRFMSSRLTSDSETSDADRSGSEAGEKKTVRKSPRDGLRKFLAQTSNGNSTPMNGEQTPVRSPSSPSNIQSSPSNIQDSPTSIQNSPTNTQNGPASIQNSSANTSNSPADGRNGRTNVKNSRSAQNCSTSKLRRLQWINPALNPRQKDAVRNVLRGKARPLPYIIFGPPGTGKTITLVEAILQSYLLMPESRILVATPSNSSANLITERLLDSKILKSGEIVRLVAFHLVDSGSLPERLRPYCALIDINAQAPVNPELVSEIPAMSAEAIGRNRITVSTCISTGSLFNLNLPNDHFSHIFMDEAGQATEPESMNALAFLSRNKGQAVLAGDPLQLGPVVPSKLAETLGLGTSFLARILKRFPYNRDLLGFPETGGYDPRLVTRLIYNYRSVPSILRVCSEMFYDSELVPMVDGEKSPEAEILKILTATLKIPQFGVVFEGVRGDDNQESDDPSWYNLHEVIAVLKYVAELSKLGVKAEDIGVITPYRKQVMKLRLAFEENGAITEMPKIATVEEFQGQERQIIIVSTVRSSQRIVKADQKHHLGFVSSPQRLNVAISRARALLIIVGNPHLLCYDTYWKTLFKYCYQNGSYFGCNPPEVSDNPGK